jgi:hypothetical protein
MNVLREVQALVQIPAVHHTTSQNVLVGGSFGPEPRDLVPNEELCDKPRKFARDEREAEESTRVAEREYMKLKLGGQLKVGKHVMDFPVAGSSHA